MDRTILEKIEDKFLSLKFVDNTWIEDFYFSLCRIKTKIIDIIYYNPKNFINNLWKYKSFLMENFWFDHYYLLSMLKLKLETDAKCYRKYGNALDADKYAKEMEDCVLLLKNIIKDEYDEIELKDHDIKWGEIDFNFNKNTELAGRKNVKTKEDSDEQSKEYRQYIKNADEKRTKDIKDLFNIMNKNILNWWD